MRLQTRRDDPRGRARGVRMPSLDAGLAVALPLVAGLYLWQALVVPEPARRLQVSVGAFPVAVAVALLASALACTGLTLHRRRSGAAVAEETDETEISSWSDLIFCLVALVVLAAALKPLGYIIVASAFTAGVATLYAPEKLLRNVLVGIGLAVASYLLFTRYLGILLPPGVLSGLGLA